MGSLTEQVGAPEMRHELSAGEGGSLFRRRVVWVSRKCEG